MFAEQLRIWWRDSPDTSPSHSTRGANGEQRPRNELTCDEDFRRLTVLLLDLGLCGAPLDRHTIHLARALLAVAEDARRTALQSSSHPVAAAPEWICLNCRETNPGGFDLCWHCQCDRPLATDRPFASQ